ncbi:hypothetical protein [Pseudoxanthomonas mexicana]|uniref:hypothetical protein n=1 Tax=Pseudoxanthomonas mexicana TaxID=128785 RepID=UPI002898FE73|nr:hypothetical protein [Pseudoxanthomonas mexicana]
MHRFDGFVAARKGDLRRIAYATQGEFEIDDLIQEAWVIAVEISGEMEDPFDFSNVEHQERLLARMYVRFVRYADKTVRFAVKLDRGWDEPAEETVGATLSTVLSGPESDDPLVRGLIEDQASELMEMVRASYSQAAAYVILLSRVDWDLGDLADLIWVGRDTARRRLGRAAGLVAVQPSCFDGVEQIPEDFHPWRRRWIAGARYFTPEGQGMFWPV